MKYLKHNNHIFKQSILREGEFFAIDDPNLFIILNKTGKVYTKEDTGYSDYTGILYKDNIDNVIEKDLTFIEEELPKDARDLITPNTSDDWVIGIKLGEENWYVRDICLVEQSYNDDTFRTVYFSVNMADTVIGLKYEEPADVDIYEFTDYRLYYKDDAGNLRLVEEVEGDDIEKEYKVPADLN